MKRRTVALAGIAVVVVVAFFFLAPIAFWYNSGSPMAGQIVSLPVYRSLGCATLGMGVLYSPSWFGFMFGCQAPVVL